MNIYTIQEWLFNTAHGKYDLDLAESGIQFQKVSDITIDSDWPLDYSQDRGTGALREAVASLYSEKDSDSVVITHGGQEALYLFYQSILSPADHVITITPGWQQSWEVPKHIGADVSTITWEPGGCFPINELRQSIRGNTKLLILNSPCNPLGVKINRLEWDEIIQVCNEFGIFIINDEEYLIDFSESVVAMYENSVSVSSLSKIYGMPALRTGWAVGDRSVIEKMVNYKRYTSVCNSFLCESIALNVIAERSYHIERYRRIVDAGYKKLKAFADEYRDFLTLVEPAGTPFAWLNFVNGASSLEFAEVLLREQKMLIMPAEMFGHHGGIRVTYGRDVKLLEEGFQRMGKVLQKM